MSSRSWLDAWKVLALGNAVLAVGAVVLTVRLILAAPHTGWPQDLFIMAAYVLLVVGWSKWSGSMAGRGGQQTHLRTPLRFLAIAYAFQACYVVLEFVRVGGDHLSSGAVIVAWALYAVGAIVVAIGFRLWARTARPPTM